MSITKAVLRFAAPLPHIESYDRFLFLGPHPDDIEIGAGATAAKLAAMGKQVTFLICTDGRYGLTHAPAGTTPEALVAIRQKEARASAAVLGVKDVAEVIGETQPQVLFAPDPCVDSECHTDHLRTGEAARRMVFAAHSEHIMAQLGGKKAPTEAIAYYMTAKVNTFVGTRAYFDKQLQALFTCHPTQFPPDIPESRSLRFYLKLRALDFGLRSLKGTAEGFRLLDATHMHCLPETD